MRVFGCLCFPLTRPYNQHKLDFRSQPCVFLGYATRHKGYKCLTASGKIILTRHVVFDEYVFPFHSNPLFCPKLAPTNSEPSPIPSIPVVPPCNPLPPSQSAYVLSPLPPPPQPDQALPPAAPLTVAPPPSQPPTKRITKPVTKPTPTNTHTMTTRAKNGIRKPKAYHASLEPTSVKSALSMPHWKQVMDDEFSALMRNNKWTLVPLPPGRTPIGSNWVFRVKYQHDGSI